MRVMTPRRLGTTWHPRWWYFTLPRKAEEMPLPTLCPQRNFASVIPMARCRKPVEASFCGRRKARVVCPAHGTYTMSWSGGWTWHLGPFALGWG